MSEPKSITAQDALKLWEEWGEGMNKKLQESPRERIKLICMAVTMGDENALDALTEMVFPRGSDEAK